MNFIAALSVLELIRVFHSINASIKIRVITWNVADNTRMNGEFTDEAIDKVLGLDESNSGLPSVYAVGLQENCWMCNNKNWPKVGNRFLRRINQQASNKYAVVGVQGTRKTSYCEVGCMMKSHGTVLLIVIAKESLGNNFLPFRHNKGCSGTFIPNKEKGVAGMLFIMKQNTKSLCFGAAHLDSEKPKYRRDCLRGFFDTANKNVGWTKSCDFQFIFGDFNTRTGDNSKVQGTEYVPVHTDLSTLKTKDELRGTDPYGADPSLKKNLLDYLNTVQVNEFKEGTLDFMPTYSIKSPKESCSGNSPCYRKDRPKSWTDRIIFTNGRCDRYEALYEDYGDHFPVFAEFTLEM